MKKLVVGLLSVVISTISMASAWNITVEDVSSKSSCNSAESIDRYYYIANSSVTVYPDDTFGNTVDSLISKGPDTSVQLWKNGVLSSCSDWWRISTVVAASDTNWALVIRNDDGCVLNKPNYTKTSNPTAIDAQIHYSIWYRLIFDWWANSLTSRLYYRDQWVSSWTCYPAWNTVTNSDSCPKVTVKYGSQKTHKWECINYRVYRCGDGLVNGYNGSTSYNNWTHTEACDPESPDWKNRADWKTCNSSCQIVEPTITPECNSVYNGQRLTSLSEWSHLCSKWTYSNFNYDSSTHKWTWKCDGSAWTSSASCWAIKPYCGDGVVDEWEACDPESPDWKNRADWKTCNDSCQIVEPSVDWTLEIEKTLVWSKEIKNVWDIVTWKIKVTAVGGDVTDFVITDKLPEVLEYDSYTVTSNPWVTVWTPTLDGNKVIWNVTWKLKSWKTLEIELKTKVKVMPEKDYKNVACVKSATNPEKCDDEPLPVDWKLEIEKTLVWSKEVKKVWDIITWKIKIKAVDGDVTDFTVTDKLPEVLEYDSYTVTSNPWVTVWTPTFDGNKVKWNVTWKLKEWKILEIELKTKVKVMPEKDYKNVACVKSEKDPEKCDEEPLPWKLKIEKTLVWSKEVKKVWDEVTWKIKVTANWWDVEDLTIWDNLPPVLAYKKYEITHKWSVKEIRFLWENKQENKVSWFAEWTLNKGDYIEIMLTTYATKMPEKDYDNVACVKSEKDPERCDDEPVPAPKLRLKKTFTDGSKEKTVNIGDKIAYKISFGNDGTASATITSIKDLLPKNVKYISSIIVINWESKHENKTDENGTYFDIYGWITLEPNTRWYIILTGEVLNSNLDNRQNRACIYLNDEKPAPGILSGNQCDDAIHHINNGVSCKPSLSPSSFGDVECSNTSPFSTTVTCSSTGWKADLEIICNGSVIKTGHDEKITWTCTWTANNTDYKVQCKINGSFTWANWESCEGSFRRGCYNPSSSCFVSWTKVTMADGTLKNIEDVVIWDKLLWSDWSINTVKWYDRPQLGERKLRSINGSKYFVSDEHPFKTTDWWKAFDPVMAKMEIVNALNQGWLVSDETTEDLLNISQLWIWDTLIRKIWNETIVSLSSKTGNPNTQLYNFALDGNNTYYADGYLVHNKWWGGWWWTTTLSCKSIEVDTSRNRVKCTSNKSAYIKVQCDGKEYITDEKTTSHTFTECNNLSNVKCLVSSSKNGSYKTSSSCKYIRPWAANQACFNVNAGNFSIEEWEILPFYWNLFNMEEWVKDNQNAYTEIAGRSYKEAPDLYDNPPSSCDEGEEWNIAKNSMTCVFKIYDGGTYSTTPLYTIEWPCLSKTDPIKNNNWLLKSWYNTMVATYCPSGSTTNCYFSYRWDRNRNSVLLPSAVYYIQKFWSGASVHLNVGNREWSWNLQWRDESKKSFGEYKIVLDSVKYLQCEEWKWEKKDAANEPDTWFIGCESNFALTNSYTVQKTPSGNLTASTTELGKYRYISQAWVFSSLLNAISPENYSENAQVEKAMKDFTNKYEKLAVKVNSSSLLEWSNIKKVPGKNIYFVNGDITINWWNNNIRNPFTIVQTNGNAYIKGNVQHNMMLLTRDGNITFIWNCTTDQTVKWIFYAWNKLVRDWVAKNININVAPWCTNGWLHVQWVLIWKGFDDLMKGSRSNLNNWFKNKSASTVMNWASVLIEYSPSIFANGTMPPGAKDFTTALSIYKN